MAFDFDHYLNNREQYPDGIPLNLAVSPAVLTVAIDATEAFAPAVFEHLAWRCQHAGRDRDADKAKKIAAQLRDWQAAHPTLVKGA